MDSTDEFKSSSLDPCTVRKIYLVTYSQANRIFFKLMKFSGRVMQMPSIKDQVK